VVNATGQLGGQKTSYFALENAYWRVISLDTGYTTYSPLLDNKDNKMPPQLIDWLVNVARISDPNDHRPIVLLSHHQYFSAWEHGYYSTPTQIAALLPMNRTVLWLWGHEHRLSFYDKTSAGGLNLNCYARCVGVGGFPTSVLKIPPQPAISNLRAYDNRVYILENGTFSIPVGFNGFTRFTFKDAQLKLDYYSLQLDPVTKTVSNTTSTWLVSETWGSDAVGNVLPTSFTIVDPDMTVVKQFDANGQPQTAEEWSATRTK